MPGDIGTVDQEELGIAVIAGYNGMSTEYIPWEQSEKGLFEEAQYLASMVKEFGVPYLLGQKLDWEKVQEYIRAEVEKEVQKIRKYRYPACVQKRWHLPPPPK